ncbi:MAG: hypothetical protein M3N22_10335, partial [Acidobacteriota bacterium]|nr:hypothetical protein [Acidobacteriota bacterium]
MRLDMDVTTTRRDRVHSILLLAHWSSFADIQKHIQKMNSPRIFKLFFIALLLLAVSGTPALRAETL